MLQMGISTSAFSASSRKLLAEATPSATDRPLVTASSDSPVARRRPTVKLRESVELHVSIKSPIPASPAITSPLDPSFLAKRDISANPLHTMAALVFCPRPIPSTAPAAMASTFLVAPATSQPSTSELVYTLNVLSVRISCTVVATCLLNDATATFVTWPCAISPAKEGPDNTASKSLYLPGSSSLKISYGFCNDPFSMPLAQTTRGTSGHTARCSTTKDRTN
mmetsp:Transcript_6619/g.15845  ORF Transcript_6619/g.15845 Transcript_6619/m.15845 type:complete len:223 (+) Transcript_6619:226-894(+)